MYRSIRTLKKLTVEQRRIGDYFNSLFEPRADDRCPKCRKGVLYDSADGGVFCSNRYAPNACAFETGRSRPSRQFDCTRATLSP